jgi:hypothetical protein
LLLPQAIPQPAFGIRHATPECTCKS